MPGLPSIPDLVLGHWMRAAQRGDERAFRRLYRALHGLVSGYVARRVRSSAEAEDLVGKVFLRLVATLATYDPGRGGVRVWVMAMARNAVIDHLRGARDVVEFDESTAFAGPAPAELALDRSDRVRELTLLLEAYPAEVREMLALRFGDGLRYREIAELLGCSEAAIKQRFSRTLRELKARLAEAGGRGESYAV